MIDPSPPLQPSRRRFIRGVLAGTGVFVGAGLPLLEASASKVAATTCELTQMDLILDASVPCLLYTPPGGSPIDLWEGSFDFKWPSDGSPLMVRISSGCGKQISGYIGGSIDPITLRWDGTYAYAPLPRFKGRDHYFDLILVEGEPAKKGKNKKSAMVGFKPKPKLTLKPVDECPPSKLDINKGGGGKKKKKPPKKGPKPPPTK